MTVSELYKGVSLRMCGARLNTYESEVADNA